MNGHGTRHGTDEPSPAFGEFWRAGALDAATDAAFAGRIAAFDPEPSLRRLTTAAPDLPLAVSDSALSRLEARRCSTRELSTAALPAAAVGALLQGLREVRDVREVRPGSVPASGSTPVPARRTFASAGAMYPVEAMLAVARVDGLPRSVAVYHPDAHAIGVLGPLPAWDEWGAALGSGTTDEPALTVFLLVVDDRLSEKYGERGGRFALLEAGQAAHALALHAADAGVAGYLLGGVLDDDAIRVLGLGALRPAPRVAVAYACGVAASGATVTPTSSAPRHRDAWRRRAPWRRPARGDT